MLYGAAGCCRVEGKAAVSGLGSDSSHWPLGLESLGPRKSCHFHTPHFGGETLWVVGKFDVISKRKMLTDSRPGKAQRVMS